MLEGRRKPALTVRPSVRGQPFLKLAIHDGIFSTKTKFPLSFWA
jgi:hypothetical protein